MEDEYISDEDYLRGIVKARDDLTLLIGEIKNGDWLVSPANSNCIFDDAMKTDFISTLIGFNINDLNGQTGQA